MDKKQKKRLAQLIAKLPAPDLDINDVKHLALRLLEEIGEDKEDRAAKSRVKLDTIRLLLDCVRNEDDNEYNDALLDILSDDKDKKNE